MTRGFEQQLADYGIGETTITYGALSSADNGNKVEYLFQYPPVLIHGEYKSDVEYYTLTRTRRLPDSVAYLKGKGIRFARFKNPSENELPGGTMPVLYTPDFRRLRTEVDASGGVLHIAEGDKDTWTLWEAGIFNAAGLFAAASHLDSSIIPVLKDLGVRSLRVYPDSDFAGVSTAERLTDIFESHNIKIRIYNIPMFVEGETVKDINDIWVALNFDARRFVATLSNLREMKVASSKQRELAEMSDFFNPGLYDAIESEYAIRSGETTVSYKSDGWTVTPIACGFHQHENDHVTPAFFWNKKKKMAWCHKCGSHFLAKDVAEVFGIHYKDYVNRDKEKSSAAPSMKTPDAQIQRAKDAVNQIPQTLIGAGSSDNMRQVAQLKALYDQQPLSELGMTLNEALNDYSLRFMGEIASEYPPIEMPIKAFHYLSGMARVLQPPIMVGVLGMSGGFKCVVGDTRIQTKDGLVRIDSLKTGVEGFSDLGVGVLTPNGLRTATKFYDSGVSPTIRLETRYGYQIQGTHNHPLLVLDSSGKHVWKRLDEISDGDFVAINRRSASFGSKTALPAFEYTPYHSAKVIELPQELDELTAYAFGVLVDDGGMNDKSHVNISSADSEVLDNMRLWLARMGLKLKHRSRHDYAVHSSVLHDWLTFMGIKGKAHEKVVPECIYSAPRHVVKAFLQGLFDTDGHTSAKDKFKVNFVTTSAGLAKSVHQILLMFGIVAKLVTAESKKGFRISYEVLMRGNDAELYFERIGSRINRKQDIIKQVPSTFNTNVDIVSYIPEFDDILESHYFYDEVAVVEDGGEQHCYDVTVPDGAWFVSNGFVSHNTTFLTWIANLLAMQGYNVIMWSPEWAVNRNADRIIQQYGGLRMWEMSLLERWHWEQAQAEGSFPSDAKFGAKPDRESEMRTMFAMKTIREKFHGEVFYMRDFNPSPHHLAAQLQSIAGRMVEGGVPPHVWIVDYAQMITAPPEIRRYWSMEDTISVLKAATMETGLATFVSSQVRKSDTEMVTKSKGHITSTAGLNFRDQQFNLMFGLSPVPNDDGGLISQAETGRTLKAVNVSVTKNSLGAKAVEDYELVRLYVDTSSMSMMDDPNPALSTMSVPVSPSDLGDDGYEDDGPGYAVYDNDAGVMPHFDE